MSALQRLMERYDKAGGFDVDEFSALERAVIKDWLENRDSSNSEEAAEELEELRFSSGERAERYYGIIQEVVETLAKDGRFDRTIVAIRDELGSDLKRYTSLEWHMWAEEHPQVGKSVILQFIDGYIETYMQWDELYGGTRSYLKWAYLPYTGWNKE